jgi:hypothetical protein
MKKLACLALLLAGLLAVPAEVQAQRGRRVVRQRTVVRRNVVRAPRAVVRAPRARVFAPRRAAIVAPRAVVVPRRRVVAPAAVVVPSAAVVADPVVAVRAPRRVFVRPRGGVRIQTPGAFIRVR